MKDKADIAGARWPAEDVVGLGHIITAEITRALKQKIFLSDKMRKLFNVSIHRLDWQSF
jgi:hypothetical protein